MAAETAQIDLTGEQVGAIYGKAFFGAAEATGALDTAVEEFASIITDVLDPNPEFERFLANPMIGFEDKLKMIDRVFRAVASPVVLNFLNIVAKNQRLGFLRPIFRQVHELNNQRRNRIQVHVRTAIPLDSAMKDQLKQRIRGLLGYEAELVETVDPEMIGGIVLRIGDSVYDGSVGAELERMRSRFFARNVEAIEANREQFQYDSGAL